jgi:hypothetical protein
MVELRAALALEKLRLIVVVLCATMMISCAAFMGALGLGEKEAEDTGKAVGAVAAALPFPWNLVGGGVSAALGLGATVLAHKRKSAAFASGVPSAPDALSPLTKMFSQRKGLYPMIAAAAIAGKAAGIWHPQPEDIWALTVALGIPTAGEFASDIIGKQNAVAPTPPAETPPQP